MREDRIYWSRFRAQVGTEPAAPNPWRGTAARAASQRSHGWQEESRPGMVSIMGYALCCLCLAGFLAIQAIDGFHGEISRGAEWLLRYGEVGTRVAGFINNLPSPF